MEDLKTWFENHQSLLGARWQREVARAILASGEYNWPGLFELLGRGIGVGEEALPDVANTLRAWVVAQPPKQPPTRTAGITRTWVVRTEE